MLLWIALWQFGSLIKREYTMSSTLFTHSKNFLLYCIVLKIGYFACFYGFTTYNNSKIALIEQPFSGALKGQQREMVFWLNPTHLAQKVRICMLNHYLPRCSDFCLLAYQEIAPRVSLHLCLFTEYFLIFSAYSETILCTASNPKFAIFLHVCPIMYFA